MDRCHETATGGPSVVCRQGFENERTLRRVRADMKNVLLATALLISAAPLLAQAPAAAGRTYSITEDGKNYAGFESEATLETIKGTTTKVSGSITADPANTNAASAAITVDLSGLDTGISMRNEHLRGEKFLNAEKFPT